MTRRPFALIPVTALALTACGLFAPEEVVPGVFTLESPVFANEAAIPTEFTCDGEGKSPPLIIRDIPQGTQSLALVMDDLDAPSGHFVHWVMWDLRPDLTEIPVGSAPTGAMQGTTSMKSVGYVPPCPPHGSDPHRYAFSLYAINGGISLSFEATRAMLEQQMKGKVIAIAKLTGTYERNGEE